MPFDHFGMPDPAYGQPLTIKEMRQIFARAIAWVSLSLAGVSLFAPWGLAVTGWFR